MSVNKAMIMGNIGKDPELKYLPSGTALTKFSVATTEIFTIDGEKRKNTTWHNIVVWGKQAETIKEFFKKGDRIFIIGRINNGSYEKDGVKFYTSDIILESFSFIESKSKENGKGQTDVPKNEDIPKEEPDRSVDDDLPF